MAATVRSRREPAKTTTVKNDVTVRADVDKLFPWKYLETSYHDPV